MITKADLHYVLNDCRHRKLYPHYRFFTIPTGRPGSGKITMNVRLTREEAKAFDRGTLSRKRVKEIIAELVG